MFSVLVGTILLTSMSIPSPLIGIHRLHDAVYLVVGVLLALGGAASLAGLQWPRKTISVGWGVERAGCITAATGWAAAAVVLTQIQPLLLFGLLVSGFLAVFYVLRFRLLNRVEFQVREDVGKEAT